MPSHRLASWGLFALSLSVALGGLLWGQWRLTHDNFNQFLTFRHFVGTEWGMGRFPWWNPWINLGYPFAADPQSGAWYPFVWLFSCFSVYTPRILAMEWLAHVAIGGLGMMWWLQKGWQVSLPIACTWGITFALSGFFIGTAQILPFVIAGAWTPWVLGAFHVWMLAPSRTAAIRLSVTMAMLLLGGYPSFAYNVVLIMAVWWLAKRGGQLFRMETLREASGLAMAAALAASLAFGFLFNFAGEYADLSRSNPEQVANLDPCIWSPTGWLSLALPNAASLPLERLGTDRSHINGFIGWIPWLLLLFGWRRAPWKERWLVGVLLALAVLMALGESGGVHPLACRLIPGMNLFRHTAQFRLYALIVALLASAHWLQRRNDIDLGSLPLTLAVLGLSAAMCFVAAASGTPLPWTQLLQWGPLPLAEEAESIATLMGTWGVLMLPVGCLWLVWWRCAPKQGLTGLLGAQVITMIQATWLAFGTTVAVHVPFDHLTGHMTEWAMRPWSGDPHIVAEIPAGSDIGLWRNAPMVIKQPSHQGYNPFQSARFDAFKHTDDHRALEGQRFMRLEPETAPCSVVVNRFETQRVEVEVTCATAAPVELIWAQNFHEGWRAERDGREITTHLWKEALMACTIPDPTPTEATVISWSFDPGYRTWAAWWMLFCWVGTGLVTASTMRRPPSRRT